MILKLRYTATFFLLAFAGLALGQKSSLEIRAVLNDPGKTVDFYVGNPGQQMTKLMLAAEGLTEPQKVSTVDGVLYLFDSDQVDKKDWKTHLAATMKVPAGAKSLIVIILPVEDQTPPYQAIAVKDDTKSFPWGSGKVVNLTQFECTIEIGEVKQDLPSDKVIDVPEPTELDDTNLAQTNFYYKRDDQQVVVTERRLLYLDNLRRVFVIYKQPNALAPEVRTIQDQKLQDL